jgi:ADP-ribose pyrophosphatase YjhB (NUDIX family)
MPQIDHPLSPGVRTVVTTSAVVFDDAGLLLMIRQRTAPDVESYHLPVGPPNVGETVSTAAGRIAAEAAGVDVEITGLVGIFNDPVEVGQDQEVAVCFRGRPVCGLWHDAGDTVWVEPARLGELNVPRAVRERVEHGIDVRH